MKKIKILITLFFLVSSQITQSTDFSSLREKSINLFFAIAYHPYTFTAMSAALTAHIMKKIMFPGNAPITPLKSEQTFENLTREIPETMRLISDIYKNPAKYDNTARKYSLFNFWKTYKGPYPKGILLHGEPGSGKTELVKALAGEGVPVFYVSGTELIGGMIGTTERAIRDVYLSAKKHAQHSGKIAVVFIDEIDSIARKRSDARNAWEITQVNQLLKSIEDTNNVITIGATNALSMLDLAVLRPGRIDEIVKIDHPSHDEKKKILERTFRKRNLIRSDSLNNLLSGKLDHENLPTSTAGTVKVVEWCEMLQKFKNHQLVGTQIYKEALVKVKR